ncbi:MAG: alginate export family protein [Sphingomonadaceae bacterium]|nr:alginate export family protein [Sphingomonadaceae bacterium]
MNRNILCGAAAISAVLGASPALAGESADEIALKPIADLRLRYETVSQDNPVGNADAVTARLRAGIQAKWNDFTVLAEGEGTVALNDDYNDTLPGNGVEPFSVVADPNNIELNRLQLSYKNGGNGVTVGRQRIILDDARFVGNVGWRQNEQTFDSVRGQARFGPVSLDATYAISQRTIFGIDSPNEHFDGDLVLLGAGFGSKTVKVKAFAYLVDYDTRFAFSSQTYGVRAAAAFPVSESLKVNVTASYASQSDMGENPSSYSADYFNAELGAVFSGIKVKAGYELLGSDKGTAAFQTPLATLHKFNGWADLFLATPAHGLQDYYVGVSAKFPKVTVLPGLKAAITYHSFDSDVGAISYGDEIDASLGFKIGPVELLLKYANYNADAHAVDTEKFWLQTGYRF